MLVSQPIVGNGLDRSAELDDVLLSYIVCDVKSCTVPTRPDTFPIYQIFYKSTKAKT